MSTSDEKMQEGAPPVEKPSQAPTQPEVREPREVRDAREARDVREDDEQDRVPLRGLGPISAPVDLTRTVPELIRRRSQGRFFGRKRLSERLPFEWLSLAMLILLAAIYAALKLLSTN